MLLKFVFWFSGCGVEPKFPVSSKLQWCWCRWSTDNTLCSKVTGHHELLPSALNKYLSIYVFWSKVTLGIILSNLVFMMCLQFPKCISIWIAYHICSCHLPACLWMVLHYQQAFAALTNHPKMQRLKTTTIYFAHGSVGCDLGWAQLDDSFAGFDWAHSWLLWSAAGS